MLWGAFRLMQGHVPYWKLVGFVVLDDVRSIGVSRIRNRWRISRQPPYFLFLIGSHVISIALLKCMLDRAWSQTVSAYLILVGIAWVSLKGMALLMRKTATTHGQ